MKETIGIFAHVDAGKTTLSEMMLYKCGAVRNPGRVDSGDTVMDYNTVEKNRGITIYSAVASMSWQSEDFYLIDTPGHKDFCNETDCTLNVLDKAILVVSAVEGVQSYTEEIWGKLSQAGIPVIFFINKTDRAGADPERVNEELQRLSADCTVLNEESVAYRDDEFMEKYLEDDYSHDEYRRAARHAVSKRSLFPVVTGAALKGEGVETLLDLMAFLKECAYDVRDEIGGIVWKIEYDHRGTRWALIKLVSGTLHARDSIAREDGSVLKAGELRMQQGGKTANIKSASAGDICAVSGMESLNQGDVIGSYSKRILKSKMPVLRSRIRTDGSVDMNRFFSYMQIMSDEISTLSAEKQGDDVIVNINGTVQLEVFPEIIKERFGIDVVFEKPEVIYKETIAEPVMGYGHYEPLRHYSEVHLKLEPQKYGTGITFESVCPTDKFGKSWQNLVRSHVFERKHHGVLTGAELVDVKVTLVAGKEHYLHTSGGDFREATYRAIRQGLMKSKSVLLEPVDTVVFRMENEFAGKVVNRISSMGGNVEEQYTDGMNSSLTARVPVDGLLEYITEFESLTHGRGSISVIDTRWEPCHDQDRVVKEKGYNAENDLEQPADSIFCKKGVARLIKYDKVEQELYIPVDSY